jgi:hypothetical protein
VGGGSGFLFWENLSCFGESGGFVFFVSQIASFLAMTAVLVFGVC